MKADRGKPSLTKVPRQIVRDIANVRDYGFAKYGEQADHWDMVEIERWRDAAYRHWLDYLDDPTGLIEHVSSKCFKEVVARMPDSTLNSKGGYHGKKV